MYTNKSEIEGFTLLSIDNSFDTQIDSWIESISAYIDSYTQRKFGVNASDNTEERLFDGNGKTKLLVDDFIELDSVMVGETNLDCLTYPANTTPKFQLFYESGFPRGNQNIKVVATWGYSEDVPKDIKFACTVFVAGIIMGQTKTDGAVLREKIGNYEVAYRDNKELASFNQALDILNRYRRIDI
jgi:hypothetical protein